MNARTLIRRAAFGLTLGLLGATAAHAQGSTNIYDTNFQQAYAGDHGTQAESNAPVATGSTDIYTTDFQRAFAASRAPAPMASAGTGSTDIYRTDFQRVYM